MTPLRQYDKGIETLRLLYFHVVVDKARYLSSFYRKSLKIPETGLTITDEPMEETMYNNRRTHYKNIIRNLFLFEILHDTTTELPNLKPYLQVIHDMFVYLHIDYKLITPSALHYMREKQFSSILSAFYFRASIMNPYLVYSLNLSVFHGKRVFTPTMGWCSYLYGFLESPTIIQYTGIDVIPNVCQTARNFSETYYPDRKVSIYCHPSEDCLQLPGFRKQHTATYDTIFFSPPYYRLELYPGSLEQSTTRYTSYTDWLNGYWKGTMELCFQVGKPKCRMCYIVSGYHQYQSLVSDMNSITSTMFELETEIPIRNSSVKNTKHHDNLEIAYIWRKRTTPLIR